MFFQLVISQFSKFSFILVHCEEQQNHPSSCTRCVPVLLCGAGFLLALLGVNLWIALGKAYLDDQGCCVLFAIHPWLVCHCYMGSHCALWEEFSSFWHHKEIGIAARQEVCSERLWGPAQKHRRVSQHLNRIYLQSGTYLQSDMWHDSGNMAWNEYGILTAFLLTE